MLFACFGRQCRQLCVEFPRRKFPLFVKYDAESATVVVRGACKTSLHKLLGRKIVVAVNLRLGSENRCRGTSMMGIGSSKAILAGLARKRDNCASYLHDVNENSRS